LKSKPMSRVMLCPSCASENPEGQRFCGHCGARLTASAGATVELDRNQTVVDLSTPVPESLVPAGERKTITALFADIKGSMDLIESLDPDDARRIVDPALQVMIDAIRRYEGYVLQSTGDGIVATFGVPTAQEDHAHRALLAALDMQALMKLYSDALVRRGDPPLYIRVGINSGDVVLRPIQTDQARSEYTPIGHSMSLAARMEAIAPIGSVMVTDQIFKLTEGYFEFRALGPTAVKGVRDPLKIYEVLGIGPLQTRLQAAAQRGLSVFVGRRHESQQLGHALVEVLAGRGQVIAVVGEAGVGKSRLIYEFRVAAGVDIQILEANCNALGKSSSFMPLAWLLKSYFRIFADDSEDLRREKVTSKVHSLANNSLQEQLPVFFNLLGISGEQQALAKIDVEARRRRTLEAAVLLLLRESSRQPLLLILEDLQWVDRETEAFLDLLAGRLVEARILVLLSHRTEYQHEWNAAPASPKIALDPLGSESSEEMLTMILGDSMELEPVKRLITTKSGGNPFFIEEMVQSLFDQGVLARDGGACGVRLTRAITEIRVPPTVQGILASRIDRLTPPLKDLLLTLAVIGNEFTLDLVERTAAYCQLAMQAVASGAGPGLRNRSTEILHPYRNAANTNTELGSKLDFLIGMLQELRTREFIYIKQGSKPRYAFKHTLTQEVAYSSLLSERRALLHASVGDAIEELFAEQLADHYRELAHHYRAAGVIAKAVKYLHLAGHKAVGRSAYEESLTLLKSGLELARQLPEGPERSTREAMIKVELYVPLAASKGMAAPEIEQLGSLSAELSRDVADQRLLFSAMVEKWAFALVRAELRRAREASMELLRLSQARGRQARLQANLAVGMTLSFLGEFADAREHLEHAVSLYDPAKYHRPTYSYLEDPTVAALTHLAHVLWRMGYPDQALSTAEKAIGLAREFDHPYSIAYALCLGALVSQLRGEPERVLQLADTALAISHERGFALPNAVATIFRGFALSELGQTAEGLALSIKGVDALAVTGVQIFLSCYLGLVARMRLGGGSPEQALKDLARALAHVSASEEHCNEAELRRLVGRAMLRQPPPSCLQAITWFDQAATIARKQNARSDELRILADLCRLEHSRPGSQRRDRLLEVYHSFGEGFGTIDLRIARSLIER
jgi:predicted ATPase/class 3 adenylate cyclase